MDEKKECLSKQETKLENNVSRTQSQDALDSSSASSLSFFADHSDSQNNCLQDNEKSTDDQKSGECSPRVPMDEALKSEKAFIDFVMSLPPKERSDHDHVSTESVNSKAKVPMVPAGGNTTKVGLDHLDNLCKLMEQLSELRETNNKLQRRVQYLEDLKTLHDMHKEISDEAQYSSEDALTGSGNKPRPYELKKSATETCCPKKEELQHIVTSARSHSRYQSRRGRSQSTDGQRRERSKSVGHEDTGEDTKSKRLFPKWSRVKEAFGWESDRKDSVKMKADGESSLRRCSDDSHQSSFHHPPKSPTWSQDYPSLHSSLEDIHEIFDSGRWKRSSVASEKTPVYLETPKEVLRRQKSTPSPGSEKIILHREMADLKQKSSTIERDTYSGAHQQEDGKRVKSPWGRVKTIIERRRDSLKRRSLRMRGGEQLPENQSEESSSQKKVAEVRSYAEYVEASMRQAVVTDPTCRHHHGKNFVPEAIVIDEEIDYQGAPRTPGSSPTFHRKSRWTRVKKALKGKKEEDRDPSSLSTPASPNSGQDGHFTFDVVEEITQDPYDNGREIKRVGSDSHVHQLSAPACDLMLQLQRNLSEDFHRKIMEWERIRSSGNTSCSPHWDRKPSASAGRGRKKSEREDQSKGVKPKLAKDLSWLEKELQKIEKEKLRLSKEKQKYEERALRLEKLKETVLSAESSNKREVFVRTSAGEFRFEGISDAFTKKLYEWETKRGLGPELSTIALLDSSCRLTVQPGSKSGPLQRVVSRSESSVADIGQPSHNSSNSLPSLKIPDSMDTAVQPSRANSEPDLSTLVALTTGGNGSVTNLSRQVGDSLDDEITTSPGVSRESEEDELEKKRNDSETYYGLLEENVILLEQLKDKEEICRRLEKELEVLDKKVDVMNKHHVQETDRYREKLWEMHKPGATPRDVQCCLLTMSQLRKRIEVLEKCTEKLRNDRESVEDSFRYHSKQQEDMTLDLLQKMSELQAAGSSTTECEKQGYIPPQMDASVVERLQDLSALLVRQTQELQETLSAKSRQICQLRWELLHRDLSTVKLETELHTHTAHRKRSKYAHYRSHSSEDAPAVPLPQELECGKSTLVTEAYYNANPESDFQATELTNTVQQLNREVLKLTNATEYPQGELPEDCQLKTNNEISWAKIGSQSRNKDKVKHITVRRSSADNLSAALPKDEAWNQNRGSSSDSDDSSDDGYTKITFARSNHHPPFPTPNTERLLMSSEEHPPRGYLQRRKKLQKISKGPSSAPNRRRSNTFHNKRDFEKPTVYEHAPQKCHSFRLPTERNFSSSSPRNKSEAVNAENLLSEVRFKELLRKKAQMDWDSKRQTPFCTNNSNPKVLSDDSADTQWLREVSSDSKIPLLFQLQYRTDELLRGSQSNKCPVRSFSDKHGKETAAEKRQNYQRKKNRRHITSPDLFANLSEALKARILADSCFSQQKMLRRDELDPGFDGNTKNSTAKKTQCPERVAFASDIPLSGTDSATVTVQLPRKKSRKTQQKPVQDTSENADGTFTVVINKKRSLSSEKECENCSQNSSSLNSPKGIHGYGNTTVRSLTDSNLYRADAALDRNQKPMHTIRDSPSNQVLEFAMEDEPQTEQLPRKRKAEDADSSPKDLPERAGTNDSVHDAPSTHGQNRTGPNYVKSSSASHLDWRKVCAKKVSREGAPNVRTLIEKYNRVAEGHASSSTRSANSSNLSSPTWDRKISAPVYSCRSDRAIPSHSFSTPSTPSIIPASEFYNPLVFRPINLDLFPRSSPESPLSAARTEAIKRAKEQFIASQNTAGSLNVPTLPPPRETREEKTVTPVNHLSAKLGNSEATKRSPDDDRISNCSMDSASLVMFRSGETCQESRLSKRSTLADYSRQDSDTLERKNNLKTSKSLSNSSIFRSVLSSDFKMPSSLLKLKRSKRKKEMATVSQLCRQSLLLTTEDANASPAPQSHKSCPSSPELKSKSEVKPGWFHRNIFRHK